MSVQIFSNACKVALPVVQQGTHFLEQSWPVYLLFENNMLFRIIIWRMTYTDLYRSYFIFESICISILSPDWLYKYNAERFNGSTCFKCISASSWYMSRAVHILHQLRKSLSEEGQIDSISDVVIGPLKQVQQSLQEGIQLCREKNTGQWERQYRRRKHKCILKYIQIGKSFLYFIVFLFLLYCFIRVYCESSLEIKCILRNYPK